MPLFPQNKRGSLQRQSSQRDHECSSHVLVLLCSIIGFFASGVGEYWKFWAAYPNFDVPNVCHIAVI